MVLPDHGCSMSLYVLPAAIPSPIDGLYFPEADRGPCVFPCLYPSTFSVQADPSPSTFQCFFAEQTTSMSTFPSLSRVILAVKANQLASTSGLPCFSQVMVVQTISSACCAGCKSSQRVRPLGRSFPLLVPFIMPYSVDDVYFLVRRIELYLQRFCCRRHDFSNRLKLLHNRRPCYRLHSLAILLDTTPLTFLHRRVSHWASRVRSGGPKPSKLQVGARTRFMGGGAPGSHTLKGSFLSSYCPNVRDMDGLHDADFSFVQYATLAEASVLCNQDSSIIPFGLPVHCISEWLTREELRNMASLHNIRSTSRDRKPALKALLKNHSCDVCDQHVSLFRSRDVLFANREQNRYYKKKSRLKAEASKDDNSFELRQPTSSSINDKTTETGATPTQTYSPRILKMSFLRSYRVDGHGPEASDNSDWKFYKYALLTEAMTLCKQDGSIIPLRLPIRHFANSLTRKELRNMASLHAIRFRSTDRKPALAALFTDHKCHVCDQYVCLFGPHDAGKSGLESDSEWNNRAPEMPKSNSGAPTKFPPRPPSSPQIEQIVNDFCADTSPSAFEESGCAVCGELKLRTDLTPIQDIGCDLSSLISDGVTRKERLASKDPIEELEGPIIDRSCKGVCRACLTSLQKGKAPKLALSNGLWLGPVPDALKGLTFAESMMIARIRHNRAVVRVSSGRAKMVANVIMFSNPTLAVYRMLPPSRDEMKEVLAFIFTGSAQPTEEDFKRTPFLVRREKVSRALDWLKLNHRDYRDLEISSENLASYPLSGVPVVVDYKKTHLDESNKLPAAMSNHDMEEEEGTEEGICPFTVHGITGDEYTKLSMTALKARALKHLQDQGKVLGIGQDDNPQSMYDNPQAYPQMFPWLFPYGYGGIGQARLKRKISEAEHKRHLLMYHDKRFQTDLYFPIVAFNHEQLKAGITGSHLLAKRQKFDEISQRLVSLDQTVLSGLVARLTDGEHVRPETEAEKACFAVLEDLDHVGGHVKGSLTSKKYMRNELWSLISFLGAPSWFITLSPADNRHPICLYFADTGEKFSPELRSSAERNRLVASNPVAAARFFDVMVRSFIKNVLGVDHEHPGLYGKTSGYYGTVEQQGRLTLHLHLLLWISGSLSPQEVRDRLVSKDSLFQQELVQYLESVHRGEFLTGSIDSVRASVPVQNESRGGIHAVLQEQLAAPTVPTALDYKDPTQTLPKPAPLCKCSSTCSPSCKCSGDWWKSYHKTVDDLLLKSNIHRCTTSSAARQTRTTDNDIIPVTSKNSKPVTQGPKGCLDHNGICRARFPREVHEKTKVDKADGHIVLKKLEAYMNTYTPCLTYLMRCNTDVTSLSSGTSIKAIVSYISDYVTKPALKTHQIFSSMYDVFERNKVQLGTDVKTEGDAGRRLILKIVNSLNAKMEIGSPMASMYLLGNPDHYTGHQFVCFWWKSYVTYMQKSNHEQQTCAANDDVEASPEESNYERVRIGQEDGVYIATTNVDDYKYRPEVYANVSLYEWTQTSHKRRASKKELEKLGNSLSAGSTRSTYHLFKEGHPTRATHVVKCDLDRLKYVVPNIVGGALPRPDSGNREYYCCTMLTLFLPWRDALSVKQPSESWESIFTAHKFSAREKQLMRNFNLRYECLDARDDFHAQSKKKAHTRTPWYNCGGSDDESENDFVTIPPTGQIEHGVHGKSYTSSLAMMDSMSSVLTKAGWLDRCSTIVANSYERLHPEYIPGSSWSGIVKNRCISIFKERFASYIPPVEDESLSWGGSKHGDPVRLLTAEYFRRDFKAENMEMNRLIDDTVASFSLNTEQERAFRIIANHVSAPATEQLKMYLGGMGGTGKSQVIKALIYFFGQRKENHRFAVLAPTGTAAALLNGSTYHKALGIYRKSDAGQDFSRSDSTVLNEVRSRFQGVQYIFIDEVSMIACHELYSISARLAQITGMHDAPFGGMNVVLAGDFAQLSPVFGSPLYDGNVEKYVNSRMSVRNQETVIGKVLWHQITTAVILTQNMRQKTQTEADGNLRTALENMRYAACTSEDIAFLRTLIAGRGERSPRLSDPRFRNVSIITARNNQRDRINEEGSRRFAADHGLELAHFYSLDELAGGNNPKGQQRKWKKGRSKGQPGREPTLSGLTRADQDALWECYPHMSDHVPAKLSLCVGMPVMIRNNEATELCVTKGQEAVVVGWDACDGPYGRQILETLFVKLVNPPKSVQLADLPTDVIPLTKLTSSIQCKAKSDQLLQIKRQQIPVLLNFAMTDYASQGKTRATNVVDLGYCRDHQSYYTALSRSSSAAGTALIQDFPERKITGGISGWLRQEFRELNVLNEVTRLQYERCLPSGIFGPLRNPVVRAYYVWIKTLRDDRTWHSSLQYKAGEQKIKAVESDATWDVDMFNALREATTKNGTCVPLKREAAEGVEAPRPAVKIARMETLSDSSGPRGLIWDCQDYSCAYDSLFTVLYNIWADAPTLWSARFDNISEYLSILSAGFHLVRNESITIEVARDTTRLKLNRVDPTEYPMGTAFTCLAALTQRMMVRAGHRDSGVNFLTCRTCGYKGDTLLHIGEYLTLKDTGPFQDGRHKMGEIFDCLGWNLSAQQRESQVPCPRCSGSISEGRQRLVLEVSINRLPYLMCIMLNEDCFYISAKLTYQQSQFDVVFHLRGIVYGDGNHFVARLITKDGRIWYHDGMTTQSICILEGKMGQIPDREWLMTTSRGYSRRKAILAVYGRD